MTGCLDITRAVKPPRAAFLNYPLGHPTGKPFQLDDQVSILRSALGLLDTATQAPTLVSLPNSYDDLQPGWEAAVYALPHD